MGLAQLRRWTEARKAIEEAIALLPGESRPLVVGSQLLTVGEPARAADMLTQAVKIDPNDLGPVDDYALDSLLRRLAEREDRTRAAALAEALFAGGWNSGGPDARSALAIAALEERFDKGDTAGARALVSRLVLPRHVARILTEEKFAALRPTALEQAGERLEKQWAIYLLQARNHWIRGKDAFAARSYASALRDAGHHATLIATFQPLFEQPLSKGADQPMLFVASIVAAALRHQGRWNEAIAIYDRALRTWPEGESAMALNLSGNRARLLLLKGDAEAALAQFDRDLAAAARFGAEVSEAALTSYHAHRACALHHLGQRADAAASLAWVRARNHLTPNLTAMIHLCGADHDAARAALIGALASDTGRKAVLETLQPDDERHRDGFGAVLDARRAKLRFDPVLRAAAGKHGTIRREPLNASAPPDPAARAN
jgi:tetratricopeptide (TPR) repeat protein